MIIFCSFFASPVILDPKHCFSPLIALEIGIFPSLLSKILKFFSLLKFFTSFDRFRPVKSGIILACWPKIQSALVFCSCAAVSPLPLLLLGDVFHFFPIFPTSFFPSPSFFDKNVNRDGKGPGGDRFGHRVAKKFASRLIFLIFSTSSSTTAVFGLVWLCLSRKCERARFTHGF